MRDVDVKLMKLMGVFKREVGGLWKLRQVCGLAGRLAEENRAGWPTT